MVISVKHKFQSAKADSADASIVRPSNWNDDHDLLMATSRLVGRVAAGNGPAQELSLGNGLQFTGTALTTNNSEIAASDPLKAAFISKTGAGASDYIKNLLTSKTGAFTISVGVGEIKGQGKILSNLSSMAKNLNSPWAAGAGNGGLMSGGALVANTTYHLHALVKNSDGSFDWGYDTSATAPTIPIGYSWVGRIWSVYTNAALTSIWDYVQDGNNCYYVSQQWFNTTSPVTQGLYTVPVAIPLPAGIKTKALFALTATAIANSSVDMGILENNCVVIRAIAFSGQAPNTTGSAGYNKTDNSRQVGVYVGFGGSGGSSATLSVAGWDDFTLNRAY